MKRIKRFSAALMMSLLLSGASSFVSALPTLLLETDKVSFWQGQPSQLMLISLGAEDASQELLVPESDDFLITSGTPVKLSKGDTVGVGYPINLTPLRSGTLTLPAFGVSGVAGLQSAAQIIEVKAPALSDGMSIRVKHSTDDIYLGQTVRLEFEWITRLHPRALRAVNILIPEMEHDHVRVLEPARDENLLQNKPIGLPVGSRRITGRWGKAGRRAGENFL